MIAAQGRRLAGPLRGYFRRMKTLAISQLARTVGLSRSTLLYYDRIGLLKPTGRTGSGYRYYSEQANSRLKRIRHFREAGLTLTEIREVFQSGGKPRVKLLDKRMQETAASIMD